MLSDAFESRYMTQIVNERPDMLTSLSDFTFYQNTSGIGTLTNLSMPTLLTGDIIAPGETPAKGLERCIEKSDIFDYLHNKNYNINIYTDSAFADASLKGKADNYAPLDIDDNKSFDLDFKISKLMYKYSFFKYAPHFAKPLFTLNTAQFNKTIQYKSNNIYTIDDKKFYSDLQNGFSVQNKKNSYTFYHLNGPHPPAVLNENVETVKWEDNVTEVERRYNQALAQIKILDTMIKELKAKNLYDKTTIIFTADHGDSVFLNPVLMIKPENSHGVFHVSNAPISLAEDLIPFIKDVADGKGTNAALLNIPQNSQRTLYAYNFMANEAEYSARISCRSVIAINGNANDITSYKVARDEFYEPELKGQYSLGPEIAFSPTCNDAYINGVYNKDRRAYGGSAVFKAKIKDTVNSDLSAVLKIAKVSGKEQRLIIKSHETVLFDKILSTAGEVSFTIPKSVISNNTAELKFEFPDSFLTTGTAWNAFASFTFDTICIK